jgi:hypothetical protein
MDTGMIFDQWRAAGRERPDWGLAWFLAYQFCCRFYASHGIVPHVIAHGGLGYYGIQLDDVSCRINGEQSNTYGRMTMAGNVENWRTDGPGSHGCTTSDWCNEGLPTEQLVERAIRFMDLPLSPAHSHLHCRHKRWGSSYVLVFEIATIIALTAKGGVSIWNYPEHTRRFSHVQDPNAAMTEYPGAFLFTSGETQVLIAGDGRVIDDSKLNLWEAYMGGASAHTLAKIVEAKLAE